jgi:hypothetical protein
MEHGHRVTLNAERRTLNAERRTLNAERAPERERSRETRTCD